MALTTPNMGLKTWDQLTDVFSHTDLRGNFVLLDQHDHTLTKGIQIPSGGIANGAVGTTQLQDGSITSSKYGSVSILQAAIASNAIGTGQILNANVTADKLSDAARLGLTDSSTVRRGAVSIAAAETTVSTSYTLLTTPDRIQNVVLPTNGLIVVAYQALWQQSTPQDARAAIFIGVNQLKLVSESSPSSTAPVVQEAIGPNASGFDRPLYTTGQGLTTSANSGVANNTEVTTGQLIGSTTATGSGLAIIFAAAGTYDVSVKFKNSTPTTLTAKNRHLWVWTIGF